MMTNYFNNVTPIVPLAAPLYPPTVGSDSHQSSFKTNIYSSSPNGAGGASSMVSQSITGSFNSRIELNTLSQQQQQTLTQGAVDTLVHQGFSRGLVASLLQNKQSFPIRIWIVDNSGSMRTTDGNRIVKTNGNNIKLVSGCSRWSEMQQTVEYHANLAATIHAPTIFRLLNDPGIVVGPQQFSIADKGTEQIDNDLAIALQTMVKASPGGVTPLTQHINEIRQNVLELEPQLRANGTKVAIIVATDGLPSDNQGYSNPDVKFQFEQTLRTLEGLPVWIVVRLCTDEEDVVEYWNNIDSKLELSIEVLDDFASEAKEIHHFNRWLNYGLPLHRMREMGFYDNVLDLLDEKKLSKEKVKQFCKLLLGRGAFDEAPDPEVDWNGFCSVLEKAVKAEQKQWNPLRKRLEPWIDIPTLKREYGGGFLSWFL